MVLLEPFQIENCACYRQVFSFPLEHFKGFSITQKFFSIRLLFLLLSPFLQIQIKWKLNFNFRCFIYRPHNSKNNTSRVRFSQRVITDGCDFIFTINLTVIVCVSIYSSGFFSSLHIFFLCFPSSSLSVQCSHQWNCFSLFWWAERREKKVNLLKLKLIQKQRREMK